MSNSQLPIGDTDFLWLRYFCGLVLPLALLVGSIYSIIFRHSYSVWFNIGISSGHRGVWFVPVQGKQAVLMGMAYLGVAGMLFANCYAQYHDKMAYHYQWILAAGALFAGVGFFWCSWIFLNLF
jgi:hypothetical protein